MSHLVSPGLHYSKDLDRTPHQSIATASAIAVARPLGSFGTAYATHVRRIIDPAMPFTPLRQGENFNRDDMTPITVDIVTEFFHLVLQGEVKRTSIPSYDYSEDFSSRHVYLFPALSKKGGATASSEEAAASAKRNVAGQMRLWRLIRPVISKRSSQAVSCVTTYHI
ncbi:uncharacterized protein CLUP02_06614 [Colletotrichum lupini]|uniref:Uncharacterized protein n=1 Tax=Colletotrichum lupini TaxID=145971 RepID=A0A9Q8WEU5_9PEZI|nr:uncharacterized protein CLUP02_06614 [Colletotrichum lupini]UQC81128.1 hypothetical protein CLUP02_06614 [Colletotrichum lupini]